MLPWKALLAYYAYITVATSVVALQLAPATMVAARHAPVLAVALVGTAGAATSAVFDHWFLRRAARSLRAARAREGHPLARAAERLAGPLARVRGLVDAAKRLARVAPFATVLGLAALPIPFAFPVVRLLVILSGYPLRRYVAAVALGRFPRFLFLAWLDTVLELPEWLLWAALALAVSLAAGGGLLRRARDRRRERGLSA